MARKGLGTDPDPETLFNPSLYYDLPDTEYNGRGVRPILDEDSDILAASPERARQKATQRYGERCSTCFTYHKGECL